MKNLGVGLGLGFGSANLGGGGEPGFPIPGVDSNFVNEGNGAYINRSNSSLSNVTPGGAATMLFSAWFYRKGATGVAKSIFALGSSGGTEPLVLSIDASNKFNILTRDTVANRVVQWATTPTLPPPGEWFHLMFSMANKGDPQIYINDSAVASTRISNDPLANNNISWQAFGQRIGASLALNQRWNGAMAQFYLKAAQSLDLTVVENRRKFINGSGKPVDVGATGSLPTGSAATILFDNVAASWNTNKGNGGANFDASGTFVVADPQPPV